MPVPVCVAKGTVSLSAGSGALTPTYPAVQANDIAVLVHCSDTSSAITWPGDYTTFTKQVQTTVWGSQIAWKRLAGTETGTISLAQGTAVVKMAQFFIFRGCITTGDPFEGYNPTNLAANPAVSGTITTLGADRLAVNLFTVSDDAIGTTPATWTTPFAADTTTTGNDIGLCCDVKSAPTAGVVATASRTLAGNNPSTVHSFALIPQPVVVPPTGTVVTITTAGAGSTVVPAGATVAWIECWGAGGSGYGGGGSGGAYSRVAALPVTAGATLYYSLSSISPGNNPEANPTDTWARIGTNAAPTTTAEGCLAKSGIQAHPTDFVGRAGGQASACIGDVKYSGGAAGNSNAVESGGGGGGAAGNRMVGGNAIDAGSNHTGGYGGDDGGGDGGHGDVSGTLLENGFAPGGGGGGSWTGSDANGAVGQIVIIFNVAGASANDFWVNHAGTWKQAEPWVNHAGTWKLPTGVWVNDAGTWKLVYGTA